MHDIICKIGMIVVAGGVRRSALISSPNWKTRRCATQKGQFYLTEEQRSLANNSAVYNAKPTAEEFLDEWTALVKSKSGERGIFNRGGLENNCRHAGGRLSKMKGNRIKSLRGNLSAL